MHFTSAKEDVKSISAKFTRSHVILASMMLPGPDHQDDENPSPCQGRNGVSQRSGQHGQHAHCWCDPTNVVYDSQAWQGSLATALPADCSWRGTIIRTAARVRLTIQPRTLARASDSIPACHSLPSSCAVKHACPKPKRAKSRHAARLQVYSLSRALALTLLPTRCATSRGVAN